MPGGPPANQYVFTPRHGKGLGEYARGIKLSLAAAAFDMKPGTHVISDSTDADSGWPIVRWTDTRGLARIVTVEPEYFSVHFQPTGPTQEV